MRNRTEIPYISDSYIRAMCEADKRQAEQAKKRIEEKIAARAKEQIATRAKERSRSEGTSLKGTTLAHKLSVDFKPLLETYLNQKPPIKVFNKFRE